MDEFNSLTEISFYLSNLGLILLGCYFLAKAKTWLLKLFLAVPMLALHFIVLPTSWLGCSLTIFEGAYCREFFWIYIIFPPVILIFGLAALVMFEYWSRRNA